MSKKNLNILFTCCGKRVALIAAFRSAMAELGVTGKIVGTDVTESSPAFHKADVGVIVPPVGDPEYLPALLKNVKRREIGLVVPLTDLDLELLACHKSKFAELGCVVMIGSQDVISLLRDKSGLNTVLEKIGLPTIKSSPLAEFRTDPFYPCFAKPTHGSAGVGTAQINNEQELLAHIKTFGDAMVIQEFITGQEFTVDIYRSGDGVVRSVVPRQRLIVRAGEVEKAVTCNDPELISSARLLAENLDGMWGVFCCQCRRGQDGRLRYFEVNPRFGGGAPLSIAAGANLPLYLIQETLGEQITAEVGDFTDKLLMLRYDEAVFVEVENPATLPGYPGPQFR